MENEGKSKNDSKVTEAFSNGMNANVDLGSTCDLTESENRAKFDVTSDPTAAGQSASNVAAESVSEGAREIIDGTQLGRYRIRSLLGQGGMGSVFLAYDEVLARDIALKIPKFDASRNPETLQRFHREARTAANVAHPNLCPVFDIGEIDGWQFIAMAYVTGSPLSDYTSREKLISERVVAEIVGKVALALQEAHQSGIMHRDLKPANIMLDHRKEPIVMDFGLACPQEPNDDRLTKDGMVIGSPAYMSPEQIRGVQKDITHATDIYSLGVVLYEMLSGRLPYENAESTIALIGQILTVDPPPVQTHRSDLDAELADICAKAMAKKVEHRFQTMKEFSDALRTYLNKTVSHESSTVGLAEHAGLQEQVKLAKRFCDTDRHAAAIPILEEILLTKASDEYSAEARAWAELRLASLKLGSPAPLQQNRKQPADLSGQMRDAFSGLDSVIPKMPAIPKVPSASASAFETSIMKNLYSSENRISDQLDKQSEQKSKESSEESSPPTKAPGSIADVLAEMKESAIFRIGSDAASSKRRKDQDEPEQKS
ncbi:serine/threonine protein kinase [Rubripirellula sp.]|nr:serine/threonine-protein kinase [Rubripirellula sp.]MDB4621695.1 serine/threonine protein kinase [Rubripirellula sp.]